MGLFKTTLTSIRAGLSRTRSSLADSIQSLRGRTIDIETLDELKHLLITADVGYQTTEIIISDLKEAVTREHLKNSNLLDLLEERLIARLETKNRSLIIADKKPTAILVAGVNGVGKTTSIAKIAKAFKDEGKNVLLAAADTFRAGAVSQLTTWAQRLDIDIVKGEQGSDPAAVTYDAMVAAQSRNIDIVLVDTAGRLHTQESLMRQLEKTESVMKKIIDTAPHEVLLVLDATQGQNTLAQAKKFAESINVTGIFLSKLDGTARGGIVFAIEDATGIPVKLIGIGEQPENIEPFNPESFVHSLIDLGS